jgi:hypothetical protein
MYNEVRYIKGVFPPPDVHAKHPFRKESSEKTLIDYLKPRWDAAKEVRDSQLQRMYDVDRVVSTWIKATGEDFERLQLERRTGEPQARKQILPLVFTHLDDVLSYFVQVFCPNRGMFFAMGDANETEASTQLVKFMNHNALTAGYYRQIANAVWSALKYNDKGGLLLNWKQTYGSEFQRTPDGVLQKTPTMLWQGNMLESLDPYNTLLDPTVKPADLHKDGEFFTRVLRLSPFEIRRRAEAGRYFNVASVGTEDDECDHYADSYWAAPPEDYYLNAAGANTQGTRINWSSWLTGGSNLSLDSSTREVLETYIWINPYAFNLIPQTRANLSRNQNEIWKITTLGDDVIGAEATEDVHEHLPAYFGVLHDDSSPTQQKSIAELLEPLQSAASFSINTHIEGMRKNLYGTTFYDPSRVDYDKVKKGEINARVPLKQAAFGQDIRTMVYHDSHNVDTSQTMTDVANMVDLTKQFFPSQGLPSQIASMERAVTSQVAAVQQGANVRNQKGARLLDETLFCPLRIDMYTNIVQRFDGKPITDYDGSQINLNIGDLKSSDVQFVIGMGLKTLDRNFAASSLQSIIFALIQAPQVGQQVPLLPMMEHWTRMIDVDLNLKQFMEMQAKQMAAQQQTPPGDGTPPAPGGGPPAFPAPAAA